MPGRTQQPDDLRSSKANGQLTASSGLASVRTRLKYSLLEAWDGKEKSFQHRLDMDDPRKAKLVRGLSASRHPGRCSSLEAWRLDGPHNAIGKDASKDVG